MGAADGGAPGQVMGPEDIGRAITRIAHEIRERNEHPDEVVLVGLHSGGDWLAEAIAAAIERIAPGTGMSVGSVDVTMHRDDLAVRQMVEPGRSHVPRDLDGAVVVLVDDVVCTGRTVRAALDAVVDFGRPRMVQLAVLVDRGHREFPIRPDFVGKNLPTHASDVVEASPEGVIVVRGGAGENRP